MFVFLDFFMYLCSTIIKNKIMIKEDYCSYEVAKLLKEKGFDTPCMGRYSVRSKEFHLDCTKMCNNGGLFECAAPTHQMAMKWLRDEHNIKIMIRPYVDGTYSYEILNGFWYVNFDSYEDAVEAAIKYCLENLI